MSNFDENGWEILTADQCLEFHKGDCSGDVEYRYPLSGTGKSFVRCDSHWSERLDVQAGINQRYGFADSAMAPSDFDPTYAGERWDYDD